MEIDLQGVLVRLGTALTFLIAFVAAVTGWYLIGGTGHFEVTAWYLKSGLCLAWAASVTAAVHKCLKPETNWQTKAARWVMAAVLISVAMGSVTYYYHLQEPPDEEATDEESTARL